MNEFGLGSSSGFKFQCYILKTPTLITQFYCGVGRQWSSALGSGLLTTAGTSGGCIYRNETVFPIGKYYQLRQPHAVCQLDIQRFVKILQSQTLSPIANRAFLWLKLSTCDMGSTSNVKAVVAAFNQEMALVGAFSVITNLRMDFFEALS